MEKIFRYVLGDMQSTRRGATYHHEFTPTRRPVRKKEYYFKLGRFRVFVIVDPDEMLPSVSVAVAMETGKMRAWMRKGIEVRGLRSEIGKRG